MRGDKVTDNFAPGLHHFGFMQALLQPKSLHQLWQNIRRSSPAVARDFFFRQTAPLSNDLSAKRGLHLAKMDNRKSKIENRKFLVPPPHVARQNIELGPVFGD